jgi:hypothetical protein
MSTRSTLDTRAKAWRANEEQVACRLGNGPQRCCLCGCARNFSNVGFDFDGSIFHLLLESDAGTAAGAGAELFSVTCNTSADFLANNIASNGFSQPGINPNFSGAGLATERTRATGAVPEPRFLALVAAALARGALVRRRRIVLRR